MCVSVCVCVCVCVYRAAVELNLRHVTGELTSLRELQKRMMREKDVDLSRLKRAQHQLKLTTDSMRHVQQTLDEKQTEVGLSSISQSLNQRLQPNTSNCPTITV